MTDTRDYRQYTSYSATANLINSFDFDRGSAAKARPQRKPEERRPIKVRESAGIKSREELITEQRASRASIIKIAAAALICFVLIGAVLNSFALKNQLTRENARKETEIANAQSEYISLESKLNSLVSISMIDKYAVEELGMTKVRSNQIQYMDVNEFKEERAAALAEAAAAEEAAQEAQEAGEETADAEETAEETEAEAETTDGGDDEVINN